MNEETGVTPMTTSDNCLFHRIRLTEEQIGTVTLEEMIRMWQQQNVYIDALEYQLISQKGEIERSRMLAEQMHTKLQEASRQEKIFIRQLAKKEQEVADLALQVEELKANQSSAYSAFRSAMLDPAVNLLMQRLRDEVFSLRNLIEETQNELNAWKFTPDSNTGKLLMAKCRLLIKENEELGAMISSGRIAKLEGELALQKNFSDEVKKSQSDLDECLKEIDEDFEGMQSTIYYLQLELAKLRKTSVVTCRGEQISLPITSGEDTT